ncbi:DUF4276 family protein [Acidovorax sp. LjRoot117]|uniref:DUF4276 family protein n=1 Tax=Acidovorax sp. LjRoot117 TaxID=3342255 RepID=UPI003ECD208F
MISLSAIVEGDGEVAALPVLLRRIAEWRTPEVYVDVLAPIRVYKDRFLNREDEFNRHLKLAAAKAGDMGWILILLDADDDCPMSKGRDIARRASTVVPHRAVGVVLANREYEAWFIAAAQSLDGVRSFVCRQDDGKVEPEVPRNAKGWLRDRMASGAYRETTDQPGFSARMDLQQAFDRSRSFRKLCTEWSRNSEILLKAVT